MTPNSVKYYIVVGENPISYSENTTYHDSRCPRMIVDYRRCHPWPTCSTKPELISSKFLSPLLCFCKWALKVQPVCPMYTPSQSLHSTQYTTAVLSCNGALSFTLANKSLIVNIGSKANLTPTVLKIL